MGEKRKPFIKAKLVLVEGQDEVNLLTELLTDMKLDNEIEVREIGGKTKFPDAIKYLQSFSDFKVVTSLGIVRDADNDPQAAFQSLVEALHKANLPKPVAPLKTKAGDPSITIMIVPDIDKEGMILATVQFQKPKQWNADDADLTDSRG